MGDFMPKLVQDSNLHSFIVLSWHPYHYWRTLQMS